MALNIASNGRLLRLSDIATVRRVFVDPPQPIFRINGRPGIGLAIAMRDGGDILALGRNIRRTMTEVTADLPIGIEAALVADQSSVVQSAIGEFMKSLWQAIAIIMVVSVVSLGFRAGAIVAASIPLTLAVVFPVMESVSIDLQRISLGALIIALALLVDDAMSTIDAMTMRLAMGDKKEDAATFAYKTLAFPMLTGSFVTMAGFRADRLCQELRRRIHVLDLCRRQHCGAGVVAGRGHLHSPSWRRALGQAQSGTIEGTRLGRCGFSARMLVAAMRMRWITILVTLGCFVIAALAVPSGAQAVLSRLRTVRNCWSI